MKRTLSLLVLALALSACQDAVAPTARAGAPPAHDEIPWVPEESDGIQSLSASINGPGTVGNFTTCTFTSTVSGGTPPYSYSWGIAGASGGYLSLNSYNTASVQATGHYYGGGSGTGTVYLLLTVTDANSLTAYAPARLIYIPSSSSSC